MMIVARRASDSRQLRRHVARPAGVPDRRRADCLFGPRRHQSDLCDRQFLLPKEEVGKGMGIVGLGSGIFGYLGPQMLGYLRDATGGFTAGWIFVACAAVLALGDLLMLRLYSLKRRAAYPEDDTSRMRNRIAGITSNTVPWEILRAAGYTPRLLEDEPGPTPHADRFMEDVFDRRIRVIFDRLCAGAWSRPGYGGDPENVRAGAQALPVSSGSRAHRSLPARFRNSISTTSCIPARPNPTTTGWSGPVRWCAISTSPKTSCAMRSLRVIAPAAVSGTSSRSGEKGCLEGSAALELIRGFYTEDRECFRRSRT